jgi:hypothetical protein
MKKVISLDYFNSFVRPNIESLGELTEISLENGDLTRVEFESECMIVSLDFWSTGMTEIYAIDLILEDQVLVVAILPTEDFSQIEKCFNKLLEVIRVK